jgi:multidrug efflux pump
MEPAGEVVSHTDITRLRVSGDFKSLKSIQDIGIKAGGKIHRLGDICHVYRGYADPASFKIHSMGKEAIALAVSMSEQGDVALVSPSIACLTRLRWLRNPSTNLWGPCWKPWLSCWP